MISEELGAYAIDLGERSLPNEVIHSAKRCFVDGMAAIISGAVNPPATLMTEALVEELDHGGAQIIPSGRRAPMRTAAFNSSGQFWRSFSTSVAISSAV